jgi:flagellar basal body-associated protein FliL
MKSIIPLIITVIVMAVVGYFGYEYLMISKSSTRNEAIDGCLAASVYRNSYVGETGNTVVTEEPIQTAVDKCLSLKGIE